MLFKGRFVATPRMLAGGTFYFKYHLCSLQECSFGM